MSQLGYDNNTFSFLLIGIIVLGLSLILISVLLVIREVNFPAQAETKCNEIEMELFDYSTGNAFTVSSITCWNPITKETRIIK